VIVAIDGPAGSGKSTTAAAVAARLGYRHLDSGALYRSITLALVRAGIPEARWPTLDRSTLATLDIRIEPVQSGFRILLDGRPVGDDIRSREVTSRVSHAARVPAVRARLLDLQRTAPTFGGVVADGRDMGTVVFPEAQVKVFLTAGLEPRARRRIRQEGREETAAALREELRNIEERDKRDTERDIAPLQRAPGAIVIDTTDLTFEEQVERIVQAWHVAETSNPPPRGLTSLPE
jgi:cytidylate kinase